ncbi:NAD(P)-dependent oxidoreductase [Actinoplanes sp. LDG1-06]|uniref:NAD(P)-dependent oxidoreductase n=1 Tax=Paractinoplanes ovalisporus TaxID=2810368 RepID=A0ABS2A5G7_9ACTN|nr:NAD(P)-dependent oxidoreductase [Actinoplanes ovalisporus]MBM2615069.1 NAD(P)-dependent oxidoreductase [Actinoplanes ovalisporus]
MKSLAELEEDLSRPGPEVVASLAAGDGDIMLLGVAGKVGPDLAVMARRALDEAGRPATVYGVARNPDEPTRERLEKAGVRLLRADLLDDAALRGLPDCPRIVYLAGRKFGTSGDAGTTWALNTYLPGKVFERFPSSRIVAFSTGNVYPLTPVTSGGADEDTEPGPVGEYAQSCLGRERVIEHFSRVNGTEAAIVRLNYAVEMRYGVILELARAVAEGRPVDLATGNVNVIWQGDVNAVTLRLFEHCATPPYVLNLTGPETASVRWLCEQLGRRLGAEPVFTGTEEPTSLLSNSAKQVATFGYPRVPLGRVLDLTAAWVRSGGAVHGKATHFQQREGRF